MTEVDRVYFQDLLRGQLHFLRGEAAGTAAGMNGEPAEFPDPTDRAALESDRSFDLRIRDRERKLMWTIHEALDRIHDGTFGVCEDCEARIGVERLRARPMTTLCLDCQSEREAEQRRCERATRHR
ncbi:MAG: RNA polymerase-binding protein DksA [Deltaproteobacteria bacterium]|nr:RNA polymerase-binding protein DksA [Deltaproteobacteria bacterium]